MVIIDPDLLKTQDESEVRSWMAEVRKYGAINDNEIVDSVMGKAENKRSQ